MGRKITNKRGSHIKEAYDVVGDISTRSTLARMTRILRLNRPYKCLKLGGELHLEMGKNFGDFLGFLGPAQSWELCPRWFSITVSGGALVKRRGVKYPKNPPNFSKHHEKTEGEWFLFVWVLMRRIQGIKVSMSYFLRSIIPNFSKEFKECIK